MDFIAMHFEKNGSSAKLALVKFRNGRRLWKKIKITYYTGHTYPGYALIHETNELLSEVSSFVGDLPVFCCNAEVKTKEIYNTFCGPSIWYPTSKRLCFNLYDIKSAAKKLVPDLNNTAIKTMARYFGISYDSKTPVSIATAVGSIANKLIELNSSDPNILALCTCHQLYLSFREIKPISYENTYDTTSSLLIYDF